MALSASAQKVQDILTSQGFNYSVIEHAESTRTAQEAAQPRGLFARTNHQVIDFQRRDQQ